MENNPVLAIEQTYKSIRAILEKARSKAFKAVNVAMVGEIWNRHVFYIVRWVKIAKGRKLNVSSSNRRI